jgi:hypothetical protein
MKEGFSVLKQTENAQEGLDQENADEDMSGRTAAGWCMLPW